MNDKFGRIDDIEKMENVIVNPKLEDLTTKMLALQEEFTKEEANIEAKIRDARDSCMGQIRQNTVYLTKLLTLFNENQQLQNDLNQANGAKVSEHWLCLFIDIFMCFQEDKQNTVIGELLKPVTPYGGA
ncbi:unnamed protein product [Schistosoma mattheei]|uniref:Uncharacterized protein n=1 Tax=Schistosoma mattheei TaxID=31246 RepID=A0A183PTR1_9TREM|nr:unnamed protein product [Schistosoma mattheei]